MTPEHARADLDLLAEIFEHIIDHSWERKLFPHRSVISYTTELFSPYTFGEVLPVFITYLVKLLRLSRSSHFLDLGSGVGNVVAQVSMMTGCRSFGVEFMALRHTYAQSFLNDVHKRLMAWNLPPIRNLVEIICADLRTTGDQVCSADVIFVNNRAFGTSCESL